MATLVGAALVLVFAASCEIAPPPYTGGPPTGPRVAIVGDSLIAQDTTGILKSRLNSAGWRVSQFGVDRLDTPGASTRFLSTSVNLPDAIVVSTTPNDATAMARGDRSANDVAAWLANSFTVFDRNACVVWMLIDEHNIFYGFATTGPPVNQAVIDLAAAPGRHNVRLIDWRHQSLAYAQNGWFQADRMHFTASGYHEFARTIIEALQTCPTHP